MAEKYSVHPEISRLVGFLLKGDPLTPEEHAHVLRCEECTTRMASSAAEELGKRSESDT
jgi:hypothetical protein